MMPSIDSLRTYLTAKDTVLKRCSTDEERSKALKVALLSMDHEEKHIHNAIIAGGGDFFLARELRQSVYEGAEARVTERLCRLISMVYCCSDKVALNSLSHISALLLPPIVLVASSPQLSQQCTDAVNKFILRLEGLRIPLTQLENVDLLLSAMTRYLREPTHRKLSLMILQPLTLHENSKEIVMRYPGLFDALLDGRTQNTAKEESRLLLNLSWHSGIKKMLVQNSRSFSLIADVCRSQDHEVQRIGNRILWYLSTESSTKARIVAHGKGMVVKNLISGLSQEKFVSDDKTLVLHILSNLIVARTSKVIGSWPNFLCILSSLSIKGAGAEMRLLSCKCIRRLALSIRTQDNCHQDLINSMATVATKSKENGCLLWIARAFVDQSLDVGTGFFLVRTKPAISALLCLAASKSNRVKELSIETLANLCEERTNSRKLSSNPAVLRAVCDGMQCQNECGEGVRRAAVRAVLLLSNHNASAKRLKREAHFIRGLSSFAVSTDDDIELKQAALHGVILLAQPA